MQGQVILYLVLVILGVYILRMLAIIVLFLGSIIYYYLRHILIGKKQHKQFNN